MILRRRRPELEYPRLALLDPAQTGCQGFILWLSELRMEICRLPEVAEAAGQETD